MKTAQAVFPALILTGAALTAALSGVAAPVNRPAPQPESPHFGKLMLPGHASFAPGTSPREMVDAYKKLMQQFGVGLEHMIGGAGLEFSGSERWQPGTLGTPTSVTYSFVPDGVQTGNGANVLHSVMANTVGNETLWKSRFAQALNEWAEDTAIVYTEVSDDGASWNTAPGSATRGDIRIVCAPIDGPSGTLAFNFFPNNGDMLLDSAENWGSGATDLFLRQVITHENGHGMGLPHSCPQLGTKIMEPGINLGFEGPQRDDRLAIQFRYGDKYELNNSLGAAEALEGLGLVSDQQLQLNRLSLHNASDGDYFRFDAVAGSQLVNVQVAPTGETYLTSTQAGNGNCNPGVPWDSLRQLDVLFDILNQNGQVLTTVNAAGLGEPETLNDFSLVEGGTYYIRVRSTGGGQSSTPIQEYRLRVTVSIGAVPGDLNGDGRVNGVDLAILLASWGGSGPADFTGDGVINGADLGTLLALWTG